MEPMRGIEPPWVVYKTTALPLSYTGMVLSPKLFHGLLKGLGVKDGWL